MHCGLLLGERWASKMMQLEGTKFWSPKTLTVSLEDQKIDWNILKWSSRNLFGFESWPVGVFKVQRANKKSGFKYETSTGGPNTYLSWIGAPVKLNLDLYLYNSSVAYIIGQDPFLDGKWWNNSHERPVIFAGKTVRFSVKKWFCHLPITLSWILVP